MRISDWSSDVCSSDLGVNETGVEGFATHGIIAGSVRITDDDREFRNDRIGYGVYHFGPVLDDSSLFGARSYHEAGYNMKNDQRNFFLVAVHDETGGFVGWTGINDAAKFDFTFFGFNALALFGDAAPGPPIYPAYGRGA